MKIGHKIGPRPNHGRGDCATCGFNAKLDSEGHVGWHKTRRVGRDGKPYVAKEVCDGYGEKPLAMEGVS